MNERNDGGPAYPGGVNQVYTNIEQGEPTQPGMSLRDAAALAALQGLCANPGGPLQRNPSTGWGLTNCVMDDVVDMAFFMADAFIAARERS